MQALAEAVAFGLRAGLQRERLIEVLGATAVVSPSQKSKLDNVLHDVYPPAFPLRLMFKDLPIDSRHGDGPASRDARHCRRTTDERGLVRAAVGRGPRGGLSSVVRRHGADNEMKERARDDSTRSSSTSGGESRILPQRASGSANCPSPTNSARDARG